MSKQALYSPARAAPRAPLETTSVNDRTPEGRAERVARSFDWLARYAPLLDDAAAFRAALDEAPPVDLFCPPARRGADAVAAGLEERGLRVRRFPFAPHHLRVEGATGAGTFPETLFGFAYPQGVSSALGPQALAPRAGETVLDVCAAPGGKTALLDALAGGGAAMIAGEGSGGRTGMLVQTLARCGAASTVVVHQDGQAFPLATLFDVILLDAPCTGEGTFRVPSPRYELRGADGVAQVPPLQGRLLTRALNLLAPGGRLVYSTCAYAPEENEAVLTAALAARDDVEIVPLPETTPGLPGVTSWNGAAFRPTIERARRIFPHHFGSWGFFVALLRKDPNSTRVARPRRAPNRVPEPPRDDPQARAIAVEHLRETLGVAEADLEGAMVLGRGRDFFALNRGAERFDLGKLKVVAPGMRLIHRAGRGLQATNAALRWLGPRITKNVVDLDLALAAEALETNELAVSAPDAPLVALRVDGVVAAKGHVNGGRLGLEIPRGWR